MDSKKIKTLLIILSLINLALIFLLLNQGFETADTPCYVFGARLLTGLPGGEDCFFRTIKPLPLITAGAFELLSGHDARYGLQIQNVIFYLLSVILMFKIIEAVFKNYWQAFLGGLVFATSPPVLAYGLAYLTDMAGWFFILLGTYLTIARFPETQKQRFNPLFIGLVLGLGFLYKESAVAGLVFFTAYTFFDYFVGKPRISLPATLKPVVTALIGFSLPIIASHVVIGRHSGYPLFDYYVFTRDLLPKFYTPYVFIKSITRTFYIYWLAFLAGALRFWRETAKTKRFNLETSRFLVASGATLLLWPMWAHPYARVLFLAAPFLISVASYGLGQLTKKAGLISILLVTLLTYYTLVTYGADFVFVWRL